MKDITRFTDLAIRETIKQVLEREGFVEMTAVQAATVPPMLKGRDVVVQSETGSGKTLAYVLPLLDALPAASRGPWALVIVPTRELCLQIQTTLLPFGTAAAVLIGGSPIEDDVARLGSAVLLATPGRLLELMLQHPNAFAGIRFLVLDESDRLLDAGFEAKLNRILGLLPRTRLTGLFSATSSDAVSRLVRHALRSPVCIKTSADTPSQLQLRYLVVPPQEKLDVLLDVSKNKKVIVFFATCAEVDFFHSLFRKYHEAVPDGKKGEGAVEHAASDKTDDSQNAVPDKTDDFQNAVPDKINDSQNAVPGKTDNSPSPASSIAGLQRIHGKMEQRERALIYDKFQEDGGLLFCTDVAARGIDFKDIDLVVHFDVPKDTANVIHRSGRTARNGAEGASLLLVMPNELAYLDFLRLKGIGVDPLGTETRNAHCLDTLREYVDEAVLSLAVRAFVTYVRSYKEHIVNYVLNYRELDYDGLATLFFLRKIPTMPELRKVRFQAFQRPDHDDRKRDKSKRQRKHG